MTFALGLVAPGLAAGAGDPGLLLELDRARFQIEVRDLRDGSEGPRLRVVIGSPAHPTPSGRFELHAAVLDPSWRPGPTARAAGAQPVPPSPDGPLGVAKLSFAAGGIALHGGAHPWLVGKPASLGCVRATDADLLALLDWMAARGAFQPEQPRRNGERVRPLRRPARIVVR